MIKLLKKNLIDPEAEIHYAYHKSLAEITVPHKHDFYEIFLVVKGSAVHYINEKTETLSTGDLVFIRPDDTHYYSKSAEASCELINLAFPPETILSLFEYLGEGYNAEKLFASEHPPVIRIGKIEKEMLVERFERLNTLSRTDKKKIKTELRILLADIFSKYFYDTKSPVIKGVPQWLVKLRSEMDSKINFTGGITKMYELCNKSPEHMSRSFRKYFGESPTDYINNLRLNYSANLLSNSDEDITNIAMECGYDNLSHFYHLFRKKFGTSPKNFRMKHRKTIIPY